MILLILATSQSVRYTQSFPITLYIPVISLVVNCHDVATDEETQISILLITNSPFSVAPVSDQLIG